MNNFISYYPTSFKQIFYRKIKDNRIGTVATVELLGKKTKSFITLIQIVGNKKYLYVCRKQVWRSKI